MKSFKYSLRWGISMAATKSTIRVEYMNLKCVMTTSEPLDLKFCCVGPARYLVFLVIMFSKFKTGKKWKHYSL